jgi:hypothetical protein
MESNIEPIVVISPIVCVSAKYRPLYCELCEKVTTHELSGDFYVCECKNVITYHINRGPAMWAI